MINSRSLNKRRSRYRREQVSTTKIQSRDIEILKAIHSYRILTTSQIASLFFGTKKRAERRLRKLYDAELIDRIFRPVVMGTAEIIYILDSLGISVLSQKTGMDRGEISDSQQRARKLKSLFLDHFIDINQFRVALTLASASNSCELLFWKYENELKNRSKEGVLIADKVRDPENPGRTIPVAPDAFFGLQTPKGKAYFFLEIDRATMSNSRFKRKMTGYARYWLDKVYEEKWGYKSFRVLTTTTRNRLPNLLETTGQIREKQLLPMFCFTDRENITQEKLLSKIWRAPNDEKAMLLF